MTFGDPIEAKNFFVSRIVEQASREGEPLSALEQKMLRFTETGSDAKSEYLEAAQEFDSKYDMETYEKKIQGLLQRAFEREVNQAGRGSDSDVKAAWRQAYEVLSREDHYVLVMINEALGSKLGKKHFGIF